MTDYTAPVRDMQFVIEDLIGLDTVASLEGYEEATPDLVRAVLTEAGRLGSDVLAPINRTGDKQGSRLENGIVVTPDGFSDAYNAFVEGGWNGIPFNPDHGGMGLPWIVATAASEIWGSANMAFSLCPMLTQGAIELLEAHATDDQKETWLPKLTSGEWTGTMNLTEPHAGTDLGLLRTKAVKDGDHYLLSGTKIFITWGEHEMTDNIVHLVLARTPDAPAGIKGISLFIVPKFLLNDDGTPGPRNDLRCVSLEHKLGIHASPTCVMAYGDNEGAVGYLVGEENRGIEYMFTMMNNMRLAVGLEGVSICERAYQQARDYAKTRVQGRDLRDPKAGNVTIINHPDVRRNLLTMRAYTEATRALSYTLAASLDIARKHPDADTRDRHQRRVDLLIPVSKAWGTDLGVESASIGIQVHGGMGFIEETGAAQHMRDSRIAPIYEGTNGIQAMDLLKRKILGDHGTALQEFIDEVRAFCAAENAAGLSDHLATAVDALEAAGRWMLGERGDDPTEVFAGASPFLRALGCVAGGYMLVRSAAIAEKALEGSADDPDFFRTKLITARFFAENVLPQTASYARMATNGAEAVMALSEDAF